MKFLIVFAHPEPRSLNGSLLRLAKETLEQAGHSVMVSDLYARNGSRSSTAKTMAAARSTASWCSTPHASA